MEQIEQLEQLELLEKKQLEYVENSSYKAFNDWSSHAQSKGISDLEKELEG